MKIEKDEIGLALKLRMEMKDEIARLEASCKQIDAQLKELLSDKVENYDGYIAKKITVSTIERHVGTTLRALEEIVPFSAFGKLVDDVCTISNTRLEAFLKQTGTWTQTNIDKLNALAKVTKREQIYVKEASDDKKKSKQ